MTGTVYHLLTRPETYRKLKEEILNQFKSPEEMTVKSLAQMKYLNAVIEEGLRMFPPAPVSLNVSKQRP